ncbi:MAG TPA: lipase secretion chaperone [Rhizobacter sp.]|nr:lipase secretion chaperone [Rhizobacter sp.]
MRANKRLAAGAVAAALLLGAWVWLGRAAPPEAAHQTATPEGVDVWLSAGTGPAQADASPVAFRTGLEALPASLQGTEVGGELEVDAQGRLKVTRGLRLMFDYFLSADGEETAARQRDRVRAYVSHRLRGTPAGEQALALLDSYLAYKSELARTLAHSRAASLADMRARMGVVSALRARHFDPQVAAAFFGEEESYDRYTLARMAVLEDRQLSPAQQAARIAELRNAQPEAVRQQMDVLETVQTLDALTTAWQQRAGKPQELRELRENLVGREAADRLEALDRQTESWDSRVAAYLQLRARILDDTTLAESMRQQQVEALRNDGFAGPERIRIETIERIQDSAARDAATVPRSPSPG